MDISVPIHAAIVAFTIVALIYLAIGQYVCVPHFRFSWSSGSVLLVCLLDYTYISNGTHVAVYGLFWVFWVTLLWMISFNSSYLLVPHIFRIGYLCHVTARNWWVGLLPRDPSHLLFQSMLAVYIHMLGRRLMLKRVVFFFRPWGSAPAVLLLFSMSARF